MNIQIFGTKKSFDTKKAERYFKERRINFQFIDMKEKGISKGELTSVISAVGINEVIDTDSKKYEKSDNKILHRIVPDWMQPQSTLIFLLP